MSLQYEPFSFRSCIREFLHSRVHGKRTLHPKRCGISPRTVGVWTQCLYFAQTRPVSVAYRLGLQGVEALGDAGVGLNLTTSSCIREFLQSESMVKANPQQGVALAIDGIGVRA